MKYSKNNTLARDKRIEGYLLNKFEESTIRTFAIQEFRKGKIITRWNIPVHDASNNSMGVVIRDALTLTDKYVGGFIRADVVYNLNRVLQLGKYSESVTITEEIADCIKLWQAGDHHVVSLFGPGISEAQVDLIFSLTSPRKVRLVLSARCPDGKARRNAIALLASKSYVRLVDSIHNMSSRF